MDWIYLAQDTDQQRVLGNMIMNIRIFPTEQKFHYHEVSWLKFEAQWSLYVPYTGHYVPHSGHYMYHQFDIQQFHVLPTRCIYAFCVDLRPNSHYFPIQH